LSPAPRHLRVFAWTDNCNSQEEGMRQANEGASMNLQTNEVTQTNQPHPNFKEKIDVSLSKKKPHHYSITIGKPPGEVYRFFRDFKNLPKFMKDLADIEILSDTLSRWTVQLKSGKSVHWDAEILKDLPEEIVSWQSVGDSEVRTQGSIWFSEAPADLGTVV
jgi:uncharacterized membrane protein